MPAVIEVKYFNTFVLKKVNDNVNYGSPSFGEIPIWNGSKGIPQTKGGYPGPANTDENDWVIEESRIRGG